MWKHEHVEQAIRAVAYFVGARLYGSRAAENPLLRIHTLRITAAERLSAWLLTWCDQPESLGSFLMGEEFELVQTAVDGLLKPTVTRPEQVTLQLGFGRKFLGQFSSGPLNPILPSRILAFHWGVLLMRGAADPDTSAVALHGLLKGLDVLVPEVNLSIVAYGLCRTEFAPTKQLREALAAGVQVCGSFPDADASSLSAVRLCDGPSAIAEPMLRDLKQLLVK